MALVLDFPPPGIGSFLLADASSDLLQFQSSSNFAVPKKTKGFYQTVSAELSQQAFTGHEEYEPDYMSRYYFRSIPLNLQTTDNQSIAGMTAS